MKNITDISRELLVNPQQIKSRYSFINFLEGVVIHHMGGDYDIRAIANYWVSQNGAGNIPYDFYIDEDGQIFRLKHYRWIGWHSGNWVVNRKAIGVVLHGNLSEKQPTDKMLNALNYLLEDGLYAGDDPVFTNEIKWVKGHNGIVSTECPGKNFPLHLFEFDKRSL